MKLEFIETDRCPVCGCDAVAEESVEFDTHGNIRRHSNGGLWEQRVFACGCRISYYPNFGKEEISGRCSKSPEYIEMIKKRKEAKQKLFSSIAELDTDEEYKSRLCKAIEFV